MDTIEPSISELAKQSGYSRQYIYNLKEKLGRYPTLKELNDKKSATNKPGQKPHLNADGLTAKELAEILHCDLSWIYLTKRKLGYVPSLEYFKSRQGKIGRPLGTLNKEHDN